MRFRRSLLVFLGVVGCLTPLRSQSGADARLAPTPPMGWNSWDSFGLTVTEAEFRDNARWFAQYLKPLGWKYLVVDEGWYLKNPEVKGGHFDFTMDAEGRYIPAVNRFPSAGAKLGFKPLADFVHGMGLKFGIHIIRGIPKQAVDNDVRIADSSFHALDAADKSDTCPWNADNYGVRYNPAGQAYYDSVAKLYAAWGVDFVKVDCIAAHPYKGDEIRMISEALQKSGRPIVLSLSPGPAPLDKAAEFRAQAQMWRISDDVWDNWAHDPRMAFSQSIEQQFPIAASWARYVGDGRWPDADMLPIGFLGPRPGSGAARETRLTHDEQRTLMTLWCIFRSPLFMGGNLTRADEWTKSLLMNPEVLSVDQHSNSGHQVSNENGRIVWISQDDAGRGTYVAMFNLSDRKQAVEFPLQGLGMSKTSFAIRDLWEKRDLGQADKLKADLAPHASILYRMQ